MSYYGLRAFCAIALCFAFVAGDIELPATVKTCKKDSADYSSCLRLAIQESWPTFMKGIPELDIPPLDPYRTELQVNDYTNGEVRGHVVVKNVDTYGFSKTRFLAVRPHHSDNHFRLEIDFEVPRMLIEGEYKAEGSLSSFKMNGKGFFNISMENLKITWDLSGPVTDDRWKVEHFKVAPEVGKMVVWFADISNGDESLNEIARNFVNEYWPMLYRQILPVAAKSWDDSFSKFVNRLFSKIPFSKIFP